MINKALIGHDLGSYSISDGTRSITLSSLPFTLAIKQIAYIYNITQDELYYAPAKGLSKVSLSSNVITIDSSFATLSNTDEIHIQIWTDEGYDRSTNSYIHSQLNPEHAHYTDPEHFINETDKAAGTYYSSIQLIGYRNFTLELKESGGVTFNVYATLNDDASDSSETDWVDISTELLGAASVSDDHGIYTLKDTMYQKILLKYVTSDSTNAIDAWIVKY